jgi:predicted GNAT superfamily acetyltransferase
MTRPRIRKLTSHREFEACVEIQREVWHHRPIDLTPAHQFCIAVETGSILMGAFDGARLAGFVYSFPAIYRGRLCQHSHLLAVRPEYQGAGLGKLLKWVQRSRALALGYDLITWTFDPLQVRNASLNLHTLGAESRVYLPDFYGRVPSLVFSPGLPSDRLKVEWRLRDRRVEARRRRSYPDYDLEREAVVLEGRISGGRPRPVASRPRPGAARLLVEIPRRLKEFRRDPAYVRAWQTALRRTLTSAFARGWRLTDVVLDDRCFYVLSGKTRPKGIRS